MDIRQSLFDEPWYRAGGPEFDGDAYEHYRSHGERENRDPHPLFDVRFYRSQAGDLAGDGDLLAHFVDAGADAGLAPHPLFDTVYYMRKYGDAVGDVNPLVYYLTRGGAAQHDPCEFFDSSHYRELWPDIAESEMNPLIHYTVFGFRAGRRPHRDFDGRAYARRRSLPAGVNPLVDFVLRLRRLRSWPGHSTTSPDVSTIILNYNRALLTLQCVADVLDSVGEFSLEIVVVDNGSEAHDFALLSTGLPRCVRLERLSTNRFFGEGSNIGVEASSGHRVLFLNNDAFVARDALAGLLDVLENAPNAGAVGPKLIYPDGMLQECGATISSCGIVTQRGKLLDDHPGRFAHLDAVDYVSAACLLVPRELFDIVGGFDSTWDPAFYEDVDLCLKLAVLGKRTYYCPNAVVSHIEHVTSRDDGGELRLQHVLQLNREQFVNRWGDWISRGRPSASPPVRFPPPLRAGEEEPTATAVLFTPYALLPGGGERNFLTIAQTLSRSYRTTIVTPERYSSYRLRNVSDTLGIDLGRVRLEPLSELPRFSGCDLFIALGNETQPPLAAIGRRSIFVCQFPFPMEPYQVAARWGMLEDYDDVVVYSHFAARHLRESVERLARRLPRLTVIPPPSPLYDDATAPQRLPGRIVSVGRFAEEGHCKRQDVLVDAFRALIESGRDDGLELHLVGIVQDANARNFYRAVHERARGLPVFFHPSASADELKELYLSSSCYWHATGFGVNERFFPERLEHFGISVIEAMSAGTIPLVYAGGGPADNVTDGVTGFHWRTVEELVEKTRTVMELQQDAAQSIRERAMSEARRFSARTFETRLGALLNAGTNGRARSYALPTAATGDPGSGRSDAAPISVAQETVAHVAVAALARMVLQEDVLESASLSELVEQAQARLWLLMESHRVLVSDFASLDGFAHANGNGAVDAQAASVAVEIQGRLDDRERRLAELVQERDAFAERCSQLQADVSALDGAVRHAADETAEKRELTAALQSEVASAEIKERTLSTRLAELQTALHRTTASHDDARAEGDALTLALDEARASLAETASHLAAITNSRSWRLTRPLRVAMTALRRPVATSPWQG